MNDFISRRKAALALLMETYKDGAYGYLDGKQAENVIMALPAEQQWIPVEVACPELPTKERCAVLWNIGRDTIFGAPYIVMIAGAEIPAYLFWTNRGEWREPYDRDPYDVIAWMPLPEPYREESEDKE